VTPFHIKRSSFIAFALFGTVFVAGALAAPVAVPTYHYDTYRTGWNQQETTLSAANFPSTFGIVSTVALDDQVDAQPLLVPGLTIAGGTHDVIYVATESNTVYAIDASSGAILLSRNLQAPVPAPLGCMNNGPNVGITGTPVIDLTTQTLYVIAYVNGSPPTYQLHALNLSNLTDRGGSPVKVAASHTLTNGSVYTFNATVERQRPGLIELNGNIYAAFGSFCDFKAATSRGWLLGWTASTLAPLITNHLTDSLATSPTTYFLSAIWMSGYAISGGGTGTDARLTFTTGNSDAASYNGTTNIQESIVKTDASTNILGIFTPSNWAILDQQDNDLGAGGVLHLPTQRGAFPFLAVAAGKDGRLFLLDRLNMSKPLDTHQLGGCWCGPSYFIGSDGVGRIVTSQGNTVDTWTLILSPSPHLVQEGSVAIDTGQDPGFFTVISSDSTKAGSAIIWAVARPNSTAAVTLYAFAAAASGGTYKLLFSSPAGSWPYTGGNANIVPVVANGKVYVASYKALTIFGNNSGPVSQSIPPAPQIVDANGGVWTVGGGLCYLNGVQAGNCNSVQALLFYQQKIYVGSTFATWWLWNGSGWNQVAGDPRMGSPNGAQSALQVLPVASPNSPHVLTGTLLAINGSTLTLQTRAGKTVKIDGSQAARNQQEGALRHGEQFTVQGSSLTGTGALLATSIVRAKGSGNLWPSDH
jgi:hypothetical protein